MMSETDIKGIGSEEFKSLSEIKELLQGMSKEELATLRLMLEYRMMEKKQTRNRQRGGC